MSMITERLEGRWSSMRGGARHASDLCMLVFDKAVNAQSLAGGNGNSSRSDCDSRLCGGCRAQDGVNDMQDCLADGHIGKDDVGRVAGGTLHLDLAVACLQDLQHHAKGCQAHQAGTCKKHVKDCAQGGISPTAAPVSAHSHQGYACVSVQSH